MNIYCCTCGHDISARLTDGKEIYPHRKDLSNLPFWKCDKCSHFVGCHHKTKNRTAPLGCIPSPEIKKARQHIHRILDPLWKRGRFRRGEIYQMIAAHIGADDYHTAEIRDLETARKVYRYVLDLSRESA